VNETGYRPSGGTGKPLSSGLNDAEVLRPSQLIYIAEAMGWQNYGVGYWNGQDCDNETKTDGSTTTNINEVGWKSYWPTNSQSIPFDDTGQGAGPRGGTHCKIYNLRVSHKGAANMLMYDGHVKTMTSSLGKNWGNGNNPP
jgi:prepilin-type processing-associated H-X9-DG protein